MPMRIRKQLAIMASVALWLVSKSKKLVKMFAKTTSKISLTEMPAIKAKPPAVPLFKLCLITVKTIGPTEIANNKPSVIPLSKASVIIINPETSGRNENLKVVAKLVYLTSNFVMINPPKIRIRNQLTEEPQPVF